MAQRLVHIPMAHELLVGESLIGLLLLMLCNDLCRCEVHGLGHGLRYYELEMSDFLF